MRIIWLTIDGHRVQFWLSGGTWDFGFDYPMPTPIERYDRLWCKITDHLKWVNSLERGPNGPTWGDLTGEELFKQLLEDK